ncbi:MAG: HNH endonuclease [Actinomycetota bacterium]|nr:HNH endonuclease [Actinomycetota bacterium]
MSEQDEVSDPGAEVLDRIKAIEAERCRLEAEQIQLMDGFVALARAAGDNALFEPRRASALLASFAKDEIAAELSWSRHRVSRQMKLAQHCRSELPRLWELWRIGALDGWRVQIVVDTSCRLSRPRNVAALDEAVTDPRRGNVTARTVSELRQWCNRFVSRTEPEEFEKRHRAAMKDRRVETWQQADGMGGLFLSTSGINVAAIDALLTRRARELGADDPRTLDQRRADLFVEGLLGRNHAEGSTVGVDLTVVVPASALLGLDEAPGRLVDGTPVPAGVIRTLAGEPGTLFHRLVTDSMGNVLDVARLGRFPDPLLRLAVQVRDGTCMFPGCQVSAERCDEDHTVPHPRGPTCWCNLACLCRRHHRLKQQPDVTLRQPHPGVLEWTLPTGRTYVVVTDPIESACQGGALEFDQEMQDLLDPWIEPYELSIEELRQALGV